MTNGAVGSNPAPANRGGFVPAGEPTPDVAAVINMIDCINRGDVDGIDALISDHHTMLVFEEEPRVDRDAVVHAWRRLLTRYPNYRIHPLAFTVTDGVAVLGYTTGFAPHGGRDLQRPLPRIWFAQVPSRRIALWRISEDTPLRRVEYGFPNNRRQRAVARFITPPAMHTASTPPARIVLSIEDNASNQRLVERVFERRPDINLIAADRGDVGFEMARVHRPAVVLLDLDLPDVTGAEVLARLRSDPLTHTIPVVIVSADANAAQIQRLLMAGATAYLTKPIDIRELAATVDELIRAPDA